MSLRVSQEMMGTDICGLEAPSFVDLELIQFKSMDLGLFQRQILGLGGGAYSVTLMK